MRVIDGAHRLRAAMLRGESEIQVRFFDGNEADAFVLAVEANIKHGLPLSRADRRAAAERIIASHPHWSDRAIASATGLAAKTVGATRRRATGEVPQLRARVGRDGRTRPLDAADGRRRATALIRENPAASMRQIAAAAQVSQGTARDVRDRLARGEDPVAPQRRRASQPKQQQFKGGGRPSDRQFTALASSPENRALLLERLKQDPSLRFTETGRTLIRLLDLNSIGPHEWGRLVDTAPAHCRDIIAELIRACAEMWQELASRFDQGACAGSYEVRAGD
ncbi:ParB/RepB/Spo0J family partition protein [Streptomyces sp. NPDC005402]|uniref:ParB/RepB/Spo0J family partition protein n=1 Tax=Streptomyces sp. NPDC005402 TaxID=3155338 RepID=UPI0033AB306B